MAKGKKGRPALFRLVENCQREHARNYECTGTSLEPIQCPQQLARNFGRDGVPDVALHSARVFLTKLMLIANSGGKLESPQCKVNARKFRAVGTTRRFSMVFFSNRTSPRRKPD
ncbi:hypothetical protein ALC57_10191 [Trachymyrmex cornetzi]|uniref:Uncharacterized protein n=1 Tax=Trachymyrmex cornetzi TaxID=471704 RepID=A0A151J4C9_9HYME|nr:hypothetical protein ALC57_10191 [Trachymyrmex cornetzi]